MLDPCVCIACWWQKKSSKIAKPAIRQFTWGELYSKMLRTREKCTTPKLKLSQVLSLLFQAHLTAPLLSVCMDMPKAYRRSKISSGSRGKPSLLHSYWSGQMCSIDQARHRPRHFGTVHILITLNRVVSVILQAYFSCWLWSQCNWRQWCHNDTTIHCRDAAIDEQLQTSSHVISWVSKQLMRDRNTGDFGNYGERLYAEALHDLERKQAEVSFRAPLSKWCARLL